MSTPLPRSLVEEAITERAPLFDEAHECAIRLFNGFSEGCANLVIDLYARTAVIQIHRERAGLASALAEPACEAIRRRLPWVNAALIKRRSSPIREERLGTLAFGVTTDTQIREGGLLYAVNLRLHQDCSLYLDTRGVRAWAMQMLAGRTVLNAFAYTGSLGVASVGGGARQVVQLDRTERFLDVGRSSYDLNHFPIRPGDFVRADFFREAGRLRRNNTTFDCVFLDPPFFSDGGAGRIDQQSGSERLINKVRPLVVGGGDLVAINNALYVSGATYMRTLERLASDGYVEIKELLPVPADYVGLRRDAGTKPITDPAPFNHSTKIALLRVRATSPSGRNS